MGQRTTSTDRADCLWSGSARLGPSSTTRTSWVHEGVDQLVGRHGHHLRCLRSLTASTGSVSNPFGFAGQYTDAETGLVYLRSRYYDPATAQFLSRDPLAALTREAYGYVGGNPLNATDLNGFNCIPTGPLNGTATAGPGGSPLPLLGGIAENAGIAVVYQESSLTDYYPRMPLSVEAFLVLMLGGLVVGVGAYFASHERPSRTSVLKAAGAGAVSGFLLWIFAMLMSALH
ncbi:MAG TPA: RHS repeat-associated core domain-containing protein [Actinomycetota bacterium]|nr:RHS repeat-associated core domain-containing protein [Actinomycetota bacterium]